MKLRTVLSETFTLLRDEPKIYLPRIVTTFIYTVFILYTARLSLKITNIVTLAQTRAGELGTTPDLSLVFSELSGPLMIFTVLFLISYITDILSYGMYVRIVRDYHEKKPIKIIGALIDALRKWKTLFGLSIVILVCMAGVFVVYALLGSKFLITQSAIYPVLALMVLLLGLIGFALVFFFAIPVVIAEDKSTFKAISRSTKLGFKNRGIVIKTNLIFAVLIIVTLLVAMATDFKGKIGILAIAVFIVARLFQAFVYTYISVVNPAVYFHLENNG